MSTRRDRDRGPVTDEQLSPTPRLKEVMTRAAEIAREHGIAAIGVEHVVLAALEDERSVPAQMLARRVDLAVARDDLEQFLRSPAYRGER